MLSAKSSTPAFPATVVITPTAAYIPAISPRTSVRPTAIVTSSSKFIPASGFNARTMIRTAAASSSIARPTFFMPLVDSKSRAASPLTPIAIAPRRPPRLKSALSKRSESIEAIATRATARIPIAIAISRSLLSSVSSTNSSSFSFTLSRILVIGWSKLERKPPDSSLSFDIFRPLKRSRPVPNFLTKSKSGEISAPFPPNIPEIPSPMPVNRAPSQLPTCVPKSLMFLSMLVKKVLRSTLFKN